MPTRWVQEAGIRTEPAPSEPSAAGTRPAATAAADPPEEPPGRVLRAPRIAGGAEGGPLGEGPLPELAGVGLADDHGPGRAQPPYRLAVLGDRRELPRQPNAVGSPATSMSSLTATGTPSSGRAALAGRPDCLVRGVGLGERGLGPDDPEGVGGSCVASIRASVRSTSARDVTSPSASARAVSARPAQRSSVIRDTSGKAPELLYRTVTSGGRWRNGRRQESTGAPSAASSPQGTPAPAQTIDAPLPHPYLLIDFPNAVRESRSIYRTSCLPGRAARDHTTPRAVPPHPAARHGRPARLGASCWAKPPGLLGTRPGRRPAERLGHPLHDRAVPQQQRRHRERLPVGRRHRLQAAALLRVHTARATGSGTRASSSTPTATTTSPTPRTPGRTPARPSASPAAPTGSTGPSCTTTRSRSPTCPARGRRSGSSTATAA